MSAAFRWAVDTPDGVAAGGECEFLVLPTERGEVGVLAGHAPLLTNIVPGALRVKQGDVEKRIPVGRGVAEVRDDFVHLFVAAAAASPST